MARNVVKTFGVKEGMRNMRKLPPAVRKDVKDAVSLGANDLQTEAMRTVAGSGPLQAFDTGRLTSSHVIEFTKDGLTASIGPEVEYGLFVHEGTTKMPPRPWLLDTWDRPKGGIIKEIGNAVKKATRKAAV